MWAPRLCVRFSARARLSGAGTTLCRSARICRHHAGVSAGWVTGPGAPRVTGPGAPQLPGVRACLLQSHRPYSVYIRGTDSVYNAEPGSGDTEDGPERGADEALPEFNINMLVNLLRQENGKDLCVIRVPPEMKYVEYFVIVGGTSTRHLQAMAQYTLKVYKFLKGESDPHVCLEGKDTDDWMCIDFGNIVVHFMLPDTRETYELEKLWTLRLHDDQFSEMADEVLPLDFTFGLQQPKE